ncbi:MAG TPA: hypothetical protein VHI13_12305 [Candidatus Kapabacteria bacterium]|nr:hypothetical protein [Candidatus Kapabacteria bacterium]
MNAMKIHALLPLTLTLLVAACSGSTTPPQDPVVEAFDRLQMKMYADTNKVITDRPITITTEVMPLVSGKGRISMDASAASWEFLEPVKRTVHLPVVPPDTPRVTDYPVVFTAHQRVVVSWELQLQWREHHTFFSNVFLDSVFIADSGRFFSVWSHEARIRTPDGLGYDNSQPFHDLSIDP